MDIRRIESGKRDFLPLLLLGDEQEDMIDRYLDRGTLLALYDGGLRAVCVVTKEAPGVFEIKNLAVEPAFQRQGYGRAMVRHVAAPAGPPEGHASWWAPGTVPSPSPSTGPAGSGKATGSPISSFNFTTTPYTKGAAFVGHGIFVHGALSGKGGAAENQRRRLYHTV